MESKEIKATLSLQINRMIYAYPITTVMEKDESPVHRFIFIADTGRKDNLRFISLIFTIGSDNDNDTTFNAITECLKRTNLYDNKFSPTTANVFKMFYTDTDIADEKFYTDFIMSEDRNSDGETSFYARNYTDGKEFIYRIYINKQIEVGISLFNRAINTLTLDNNTITEMNNWMLHQYNDDEIKYNEITEYKIIDISRSTKAARKLYRGIVVLEVTLITGRKINLVMNYCRNKRTPRNISSPLNFLECVYNDAYIVLPLSGRIDYDENIMINLITRSNNEAMVLSISKDLFNNLQAEVMKL
ncbi:MAG: hypothetical protein NC548_15890 [Lachnospiraceae bacterium]|nr:hypothetical protein [Lachnospiraceae bacterium]